MITWGGAVVGSQVAFGLEATAFSHVRGARGASTPCDFVGTIGFSRGGAATGTGLGASHKEEVGIFPKELTLEH